MKKHLKLIIPTSISCMIIPFVISCSKNSNTQDNTITGKVIKEINIENNDSLISKKIWW